MVDSDGASHKDYELVENEEISRIFCESRLEISVYVWLSLTAGFVEIVDGIVRRKVTCEHSVGLPWDAYTDSNLIQIPDHIFLCAV